MRSPVLLDPTLIRANRFWRHVDKTPGHGPAGECWVWTGYRGKLGYGQFGVHQHGTTKLAIAKAHRVAWVLTHGMIPAETPFVCHSCDNRACVNPAHLFLGTHQQNMADMRSKGRSPRTSTLHPELRRGKNCWRSKLTEDAVRLIRSLPQGTSWTCYAKIYGVTEGTIRQVHTRRTWAHVE